MTTNRKLSAPLAKLNVRIGTAWPSNPGENTVKAVQALHTAVDLTRIIIDGREEGHFIQPEEIIIPTEDVVFLAEGLNQLSDEWVRTTEGLIRSLNGLWSEVAGHLSPDDLGQVTDIDNGLREDSETAQKDSLSALKSLQHRINQIASLAKTIGSNGDQQEVPLSAVLSSLPASDSESPEASLDSWSDFDEAFLGLDSTDEASLTERQDMAPAQEIDLSEVEEDDSGDFDLNITFVDEDGICWIDKGGGVLCQDGTLEMTELSAEDQAELGLNNLFEENDGAVSDAD